jgi:hypothetical protein
MFLFSFFSFFPSSPAYLANENKEFGLRRPELEVDPKRIKFDG